MTTSHRPRAASRKARRSPRSYTPLSDALAQPLVFADTELSEGIQRHSLVGLIRAALSRKRRADGEPLPNVLCALLVWPLLKAKSLHCFCAELCQFLAGHVSVLYDFLGREDIHWRGLSSELARRVHQANELGPRSQRAFVVDDTSQARAGRKVEGTSCYFDHTEGRHRKGHQVLQLGLAVEKGFLPLEAQIVTGQKGAIDKPKDKPFRDQRSAAARDMRRARFKTASLVVSLNLATEPSHPPRWAEVRLVFSAPVRARSSDTWVVFLCTDVALSDAKILEVYALRWSIEVYFKEIKQHLGFLKEQSGRYQVAYASVHLGAMRYLLLFEAMLRAGHLSYGEIRDRESGRLQILTYAALLWHLFRALIEGALDALIRELGRKTVKRVLAAIDQTVEGFLNDALQISPEQVAVQLKAENLGYL